MLTLSVLKRRPLVRSLLTVFFACLGYHALPSSIIIKGFYMGINSGFDKVRCLAPVIVNSRIRAKVKVFNI